MDGMILPAVVVLLPAVLVLLLGSNGGLVFLSVCLGSVLAMYVAGDASSVLSSATPDDGATTMQWAQLGLLLLPVIATIILTRKKAKGGTAIVGALAAVAAGGLLLLLGVPYLPSALQESFMAGELWNQLDNLQTSIVIAGALLVIGEMFMSRHRHEHKDKKH